MACACLRQDEGSKRRRTESGSSASSSDQRIVKEDTVHEIEEVNAVASATVKNIRGAAARNHRSKELREREEKQQKDRLDAASKRNGRAERRRGDGKPLWSTGCSLLISCRVRSIGGSALSHHLLQRS